MTLQLNDKQKGQKELEEFLEYELNEYSFDYTIDFHDKYDSKFYYDVIIKDSNKNTYMSFYWDSKKETLAICIYEDVYEEIKNYNNSVKYFWWQMPF